MAITRFSGPLVIGALPLTASGDSQSTPGPSASAHGWGVLDQRYGQGGGEYNAVTTQWYSTNDILVIDQSPATLGTAKLAALQVPVAGTPMTLAAASTGITLVVAGGWSLAPGYPVVPASALVIDGLPSLIQLASGGGMSMIDPRTTAARCLTITSAGNDTGATITLKGYDVYGVPMTQTLTLGSGAAVTTTKAFKFLTSATCAGSLSGSNVSIGTSDVYGFPLASWEFPLSQIWWAGTQITVATNWLAAVATTPSASTGDTRGTYATQSASNGTNKLQVLVSPVPWQLTNAGIYGAAQF